MEKQSWILENVQFIADEFPYTFYKPSDKVISQLKEKNFVKLIFKFESDDPEVPSAERMWVEITGIKKDNFIGILSNEPFHIKDLQYGDKLEFKKCHIADTELNDPVPSITDKYVKRCFVTNNILYDGDKVGYLYREEPDQDDDSGWRFTKGDETDDYVNNVENLSYVSLGAVLREDDSFISLLERESGVAFTKDKTGKFIELE